VSSESCPKFEEEIGKISHVPYSNIVGGVMYAMVCTIPDLSYVVSDVSRFIQNLSKNHWDAMKCIIHYVKGSLDKGLVFDRSESKTFDFVGYVDSDYAGGLSHTCSISSYIFTLCAGAISWKLSLQSIAAC